MKVAYVVQNPFGRKSRALDIDLLRELNRHCDVTVFSEKGG